MINYISINNFRCFEQTQIGGFGHVNLIGGLNNSGKTALLEAILLSEYPTTNALSVIRNLRKETFERNSNLNPWRFLFYNKEDSLEIQIKTKDKAQNNVSDLSILGSNNLDVILSKNTHINPERLNRFISEYNESYILSVSGKYQEKEFGYLPILREDSMYRKMPIMSNINIIGIPHPKNTAEIDVFFHASLPKQDERLAMYYSLIDDSSIAHFNFFLRTLDSRIVDSKITSPEGKPIIEIKLNNGQKFPLPMFGDAIKKAVEIILILLNTKNSILLIDEIENGLHYTKHKNLWEVLFNIAKDQNVQIFATTHSKEMMGAFAKVAQKQTAIKGVYFQMFRSEDDNQIVAAPYSAEELDFALTGNLPLRGENV
jgi:AAA15 family ATPase/GTPase